jgi:hypothetical protein
MVEDMLDFVRKMWDQHPVMWNVLRSFLTCLGCAGVQQGLHGGQSAGLHQEDVGERRVDAASCQGCGTAL